MKNKLIYSLPLVALLAACGGESTNPDESPTLPESIASNASEDFEAIDFALIDDDAPEDEAYPVITPDLVANTTAVYSGTAMGIADEADSYSLILGESNVQVEFGSTSGTVTGQITNLRQETALDQNDLSSFQVDYAINGTIEIDGTLDQSGDISADVTSTGLSYELDGSTVEGTLSGELTGGIYQTDTAEALVIGSEPESLAVFDATNDDYDVDIDISVVGFKE